MLSDEQLRVWNARGRVDDQLHAWSTRGRARDYASIEEQLAVFATDPATWEASVSAWGDPSERPYGEQPFEKRARAVAWFLAGIQLGMEQGIELKAAPLPDQPDKDIPVVGLAYNHEARALRLYVDTRLVYERNGMEMGLDWSVEYPGSFALATSGGSLSAPDADRLAELEREHAQLQESYERRAQAVDHWREAAEIEHGRVLAAMEVLRAVAETPGRLHCGIGCRVNERWNKADHSPDCLITQARAIVASAEGKGEGASAEGKGEGASE